jgi:hypothetical protein
MKCGFDEEGDAMPDFAKPIGRYGCWSNLDHPLRHMRDPLRHMRDPLRHMRDPLRHMRDPLRHIPTLSAHRKWRRG